MTRSGARVGLWLTAPLLLIVLSSSFCAGGAFARFTSSPGTGTNVFNTGTIAAPTSLTATVTNNSVVLNWTATSTAYATGTQVLRSTTSGSGYSQIAQITPRTTTTYTDSPGAGTYYYVARAYYQSWQSATGNEASTAILGITFRAAASSSAASGNLVINVPGGTAASNVMIASIAVKPNTATITAPAGWTLQRRTDNANATASSLAVYYRVAASEPASYTWTLSANTGSAGGIQTFSNVDTSNPVDIENGQNTASALTHASPTVTTTLTNTMLVTSYEFASSATWTPPGGMFETVDTASLTVPNASGISLEANYATQPAAGATGAKTATASNDADVGNADTLALRPLITFRAASSGSAASGNLVINAPAGTVSADVLVASIAIRPNTATITAPAGWTLIRRTDNANANANSLAVYYKVAGGSEPSSYTWTLSANTGSAGGIESFANVDTAAPINIDNGQNTANALTHSTPSVSTSVTSAMLVTSFEFCSGATWTPPGGMIEAVDVSNVTVPNTVGVSLEADYAIQPATGATGAKTATASNDADVGNAHILALKPKP